MLKIPTMLDRIRTLFKKYEIAPGDRLVVGVSGGVDSMALLSILCNIHPSDRLFAVHIDHALRPESSKDAEFV